MDELIKNANEFLDSGNDNLKKERFNVAVSDFFKAIVIFCDYIIYKDIKIVPKNHNDRFSLLEKYFPLIYSNVSNLFKNYIKSYSLRLNKTDALNVKTYAYELKNIADKK